MKSDTHPEYRKVVFQDTSSGEKFLTRSTVVTKETTDWEDGNTYPLAKVEISSASHPFFTGQMTIVDTAGRVERFEKRYGKRKRKEVVAEDTKEIVTEEIVAEEVPAEPETPAEEAVPSEPETPAEETPAEEAVPSEPETPAEEPPAEQEPEVPAEPSASPDSESPEA